MGKGMTEVLCGGGVGKTTLAIGKSIRASAAGKSVIIIQFLKGKERRALDFLEEMEGLDIKIFRFEKYDTCYEKLKDYEKVEENRNIINGLNFSRKVIATQECDFLVLDEILGLVDYCITDIQEVKELLKMKDEDMDIILTGRRFYDELNESVDRVTRIETEYEAEQEETD
ncbi:MAG TPA: cob(I)yrinic acid a,c-diamide adenosyltransferase [Candidatus Blautia avistercoris]|uniref:cob(I)yrinic acid a,c-diamide adenosyltransferase n=1 Tax=Blautia sp. An249 TaxID=1965603 RepID=UPI000B39CC1C|nr:cob(I)yrinic acid a,c-diamide adenosyltransferase [Blautia sp. An249]OUO79087.1 cob(I)yrinic acid a c-diamide adenosyltransferase [Blautia sp. An249]HIY18688.1 cob(I)yrinic acid a,c-diamide adenosyltransferase [Candidatus Blautia avistercoris]